MRRLEDRLRLRRVLDQLDQVVAEHDLAGRGRQVLPERERRSCRPGAASRRWSPRSSRNWRNPRATLAPPVSKARLSAVGLPGRKFVGASASTIWPVTNSALVGELAGLGARSRELTHRLAPEEIRLAPAVEERVRVPGRIAEPGVGRVDLGRACGRGAECPRGHGDAGPGETGHEARADAGDRHGILREPLAEVHERLTEGNRDRRLRRAPSRDPASLSGRPRAPPSTSWLPS